MPPLRALVVILGTGLAGCGDALQAPDAGCGPDHAVTLPGHEGQFFGTPHLYCQTFLPGIANGALVVVGTDAAGVGDHDCTLARAVRYHVDWGDGACAWTDWVERRDLRVAVDHAYAAAGSYRAWVFAEDRAGSRTRRDDKIFTAVAAGGDAFVTASPGTRTGDVLRFQQLVGFYGSPEVVALTVAYRLRTCAGVETELDRRVVALPVTAEAERRGSELVELTLPAGTTEGRVIVEVDPDRALAETCPAEGNPPSSRGINNLAAVELSFCGGSMP